MGDLPERYRERMKELLGEEYHLYEESLCRSPYTAFRINTGRMSVEQWKEINPFSTSEVAWTEKGFYFDAKKENPAKHPYYFAGLYYIQEPSAMIPAMLLPVKEGDRVLDLCAAPGGKATELGAKLKGTGLLVANDISVSRTMALAKNLQMAGVTNAVVTAETPERLADVFEGYFDKILLDAPCSGEGMFRREPRMIKDWLEKGPEYYADIQKEILGQAYRMLRPGGMLVYSTCTFSVIEDENVVQWILMQYPDMEICPVERPEGFLEGRPDMVEGGKAELKHCVRIFPHHAKGEGHFAVLLHKKGVTQADRDVFISGRKKKEKIFGSAFDKTAGKEIEDFVSRLPLPDGELSVRKQVVSLLPLQEDQLNGLRIIYQGLPLCEWKHKILASHQLALILRKDDFSKVLNLSVTDERVLKYLKGETITMELAYTGNVLVCVDGFGLGWGQGNGKGSLKNKYYPGWRYQ